MVVVEHVSDERWQRELAKVTDRRNPPIPVTVWLGLDSRTWDGELHGWAVDPSGAGGRMGLVHLVREFAPGFEQEYLRFAPADHISRRDV